GGLDVDAGARGSAVLLRSLGRAPLVGEPLVGGVEPLRERRGPLALGTVALAPAVEGLVLREPVGEIAGLPVEHRLAVPGGVEVEDGGGGVVEQLAVVR